MNTVRNYYVFVILAVAIALGVAVWLRIDPSGDQGSGLSADFDYDLSRYQKIDPALVKWKQVAEFPVDLTEPRGIACNNNGAVSTEGAFYVVGDKALQMYDAEGKKIRQVDFSDETLCVHVVGKEHEHAGRIFVGVKDKIFTLDTGAEEPKLLADGGVKAIFTSITAAEEDVFAADAGNKLVHRYDAEGKEIGRLKHITDEQKEVPFVVPSPYFDVAMASDGLLRVVNPGCHSIEAYTFDGHCEQKWGKPALDIAGFCGCCNPSALAVLPDGRFATGEKGIPRIKIYDAEGKFESVVVGPDVLAPQFSATTETREDRRMHPVDLAVDGRSRIVVLDPNARRVRIFQEDSKNEQ